MKGMHLLQWWFALKKPTHKTFAFPFLNDAALMEYNYVHLTIFCHLSHSHLTTSSPPYDYP